MHTHTHVATKKKRQRGDDKERSESGKLRRKSPLYISMIVSCRRHACQSRLASFTTPTTKRRLRNRKPTNNIPSDEIHNGRERMKKKRKAVDLTSANLRSQKLND